MSELPEVEAIRRGLEREFAGKKIKSVELLQNKAIPRQVPKKNFVTKLDGVKIVNFTRKGLYILANLDTSEILVIHLGVSGQIRKAVSKDEIVDGTNVIITFTQGGQIRFIDPQLSGDLVVVSADSLEQTVPELANLGVDPVEEPMSWITFGKLLMKHHIKLKTFLTDQTIIAGIDNMYSDEMLFAAGLRYDRYSDSLTTQEIRRFYRSVVEILHDAMKHGGSTLPDEPYVDINGKPGEYQEFHEAYKREKLACRRCRSVITRSKFQNRYTYYCAQCQM